MAYKFCRLVWNGISRTSQEDPDFYDFHGNITLWWDLEMRYLEAVDGEKSAEDALFETRAQNYDVVFFVHGLASDQIDDRYERESEMKLL